MSRYAVLLAGVLAAALCARLGFWQLSRLDQRQRANALVVSNLARPPIHVGHEVAGDSAGFRRAVAAGVFDFERQVVVVARSIRGVPAVHVVTPLLLERGDAILVERGVVPSPDGRTVDLLTLREPDTARVGGVLLAVPPSSDASGADSGWPVYVRRPDPKQLQRRYPYALEPYLLRRTEIPPGAARTLRALAVPEPTNGPHLSYAVQWFAFATIAVVGGTILAIKSTKDQRDAA